MHVGNFCLPHLLNLKNTPFLCYKDRLLSKLKKSSSNDKSATTLTYPWFFPCTLVNRLPFNQDLAITISQDKQGFKKVFKANFLYVANAIRSQKQNILNCRAYYIGVAIAKYKLEKNFGLFNLPLYPAYNVAQLDPLLE